ncbi:hypothetical protein PAPYR_4560 [Paratrimastix pyriformis]|uniref:YbjN domain-containing protein n=1 Tax=Paratrimastix pyriformis TaxID=342808 RepID=A0ABQ8UL12_9EUKA|nr:hypothetical protein PAPYR_4560 [Paratrimastix pyriformis]
MSNNDNKTYKIDVMRYLDAADIRYQLRGDLFILLYNVDGHHWTTAIRVNNTQDTICVYSVFGTNAPADRLSAVCEFITRANYDLPLGNWELDIRDGECRFKTSVDVEGCGDVGPLVKQLLGNNLGTFQRYVPGLRNVIAGGNPRDCCAECERPANSSTFLPNLLPLQ